MRRRVAVLMLALCTPTLLAQTGEENAPGFDVVSVKRSASSENNWGYGPRPGGDFVATNAPIRPIIAFAYGIRDVQLIGGPGWLASERFDITAKSRDSGAVSDDELRARLQALFAERFGLMTHRDTHEQSMYALVRARERNLGPLLRPAAIDCTKLRPGAPPPRSNGSRPVCGIIGDEGRLIGGGLPMAMLADALAGRLDTVVVDQTGLVGGYDFDLGFAPDLKTTALTRDGPSLFTALQDQLGLRLRAQRGPVEVVVIDQVERPSEN